MPGEDKEQSVDFPPPPTPPAVTTVQGEAYENPQAEPPPAIYHEPPLSWATDVYALPKASENFTVDPDVPLPPAPETVDVPVPPTAEAPPPPPPCNWT